MTVFYTSVLTPKVGALPPDTDLHAILTDLADNHVAAPKNKKQAELAEIAGDAREHGIPLSIVVIQGQPGRDSDLRDLATEVGKSEHGTVAVFSDEWVGTYSDSIPRARLEKAEDGAKYHGPEHTSTAARVFVDRLEAPEQVSFTTATLALLAGIVLIVGGLYWIKARRAARVPA
ncbi:Rv1476 family membrane protein [Nocardia thraciensis]